MSRILVADDDPDICDLVSMALERHGHVVTVTRDGEAAWTALSEQPFDAVVLDRMMPAMSGTQVLALIRAHPQLFGSKVVLLTAKARQADIDEGLDAGADAYITKPFSLRELAATIEQLTGETD